MKTIFKILCWSVAVSILFVVILRCVEDYKSKSSLYNDDEIVTKEFVVDNHEYILIKMDRGMGSSRDSYSGVVHKENCKYCK